MDAHHALIFYCLKFVLHVDKVNCNKNMLDISCDTKYLLANPNIFRMLKPFFIGLSLKFDGLPSR